MVSQNLEILIYFKHIEHREIEIYDTLKYKMRIIRN